MSDDGSTRTGFGAGYGSDQTQTITSRKIQVRMPSGKIYGPYTRIEVMSFISERRIQGEEFILVEGESNWRAITSDNEFFDALQAIMMGKPNEPKKKSGFTEEKARTSAPQKSRVQEPKATAVKSDTRLTNFSEKSDPGMAPNPGAPKAKETKTPTHPGVDRPSAGNTKSGVTKKTENTQAIGGQSNWPNLTPPKTATGAAITKPKKKAARLFRFSPQLRSWAVDIFITKASRPI